MEQGIAQVEHVTDLDQGFGVALALDRGDSSAVEFPTRVGR